MNRKLINYKSIIIYLSITLAALIMVVPLLWMISTSLKTNQYTLQLPPRFIPEHPTFDSYKQLFHLFPMMKMLINSIIVAFFVTGGQIITSIMAAYAFARMSFREGKFFSLFSLPL